MRNKVVKLNVGAKSMRDKLLDADMKNEKLKKVRLCCFGLTTHPFHRVQVKKTMTKRTVTLLPLFT